MNGLKRQAALRAQHAGVPLMVPHAGADASSDFESALEMVDGEDRKRELWHRPPLSERPSRAS